MTSESPPEGYSPQLSPQPRARSSSITALLGRPDANTGSRFTRLAPTSNLDLPINVATRDFSSRGEEQPMDHQEVDFRSLDYVSEVDPNLFCPICHSPMYRPVQLPCDHTFCVDCLRQAFDTQGRSTKTCPTCRRTINMDAPNRPIPRFVSQMLDELWVKCPNKELGCVVERKRGEIEHHVNSYCEFRTVPCPSNVCKERISHKDAKKGCLHHTVSCEYCNVSMLAKDLEYHRNNNCLSSLVTCKHCSQEFSRSGMQSHLADTCPLAPAKCPGFPFGCSEEGERYKVDDHAQDCTIAAMAPFLASQKKQQTEQAASCKLLQRKVEILEGGFANIKNILYADSPAAATTSMIPSAPPPSSESQQQTLASALSTLANPSTADSSQARSQSPLPPFDTPTQHLLSLHESLRDELSRLETLIADVDARSTMMVLNEGLRVKDEMAHTNAAINGLRMQVQWLTSARLQEVQAVHRARLGARGPGVGGAGGVGVGGGGGGVSVNARAGEGMDEDWGVGGGVSVGLGSGSGVLGMGRRLSDGGRQDTKL